MRFSLKQKHNQFFQCRTKYRDVLYQLHMPGKTHTRRKLPAVILQITKPSTIPSSRSDVSAKPPRANIKSSQAVKTSSKMTSSAMVPKKSTANKSSKACSFQKGLSKQSVPKNTSKNTKTRIQRGGMAPICSGAYNPSKMGEPAVISGMAPRGSMNAPFNSTTPTADLTSISFDKQYTVFPLNNYPPIANPLPLYHR